MLRTLLLAAVALPVARAQDVEYIKPEVEGDDRLEVKGRFESEWLEYNNLDFRALDETTDQTILDSDDRNSFAFSGASLQLGYQIDDRTRFNLGIAHRGLWGNDQIGTINRFGSLVWVSAMNVEWRADDGENPVVVTAGRQFFEIGGLPTKDYVLSDVLDMVRVDVPLGDKGTLTLVPIDVAGMSSSNDGVNFVSFIGQGTTQTFGFRGDNMTRRFGGRLTLDGLAEGLDLRAYTFYTDVGSLGTGSDISYNGALGNFADNDWVLNAGLRGAYDAGAVHPWASFDASTGIDRKELVARDATTTGFALGAGLVVATGEDDSGLRGELGFFQATGTAHASGGLMYNHGYVGMKAQQVGGLLADRFFGWHPTSYIGMFGISDNPQDKSRKSGTRFAQLSAGYEVSEGTEFGVDYWFLQDTGSTLIEDLDTIDPPYGYSREAFAAQTRLGQVLGHEIDLRARYAVSDHIRVHAAGGVLLPGSFYAQEIARVAGNQLGGQEMAWAFSGGTRVEF
jgi:hypothetical protein